MHCELTILVCCRSLSNGDILHGIVFIYPPSYPMDSHISHICLERIMMDNTGVQGLPYLLRCSLPLY
mgnify:CR=1 FL=1